MNQDKVWTTKDGKVVRIKDMTDRHLKSTYEMLKRKGFVGASSYTTYLTSSPPNGEQAQMAYEEGLENLLDMKVCAELDWIEEEIRRRGI